MRGLGGRMGCSTEQKNKLQERRCDTFEAENLFHLNMAEPETALNSMVLFALS
jgi:hypothetical protein